MTRKTLLPTLVTVLVAPLLIFSSPGLVSAAPRMAVKFTNGDLYLKEGGAPFSGQWHQLTSGVSVGDTSLAGEYIGLVDEGNTQKSVVLKQPAWDSPWNFIDLDSPVGGTTKKVAMTQTSDGNYRIVILKSDGSVVMKDGAWNSGYWSGTIEPNGVTDVVATGDNVGLIKTNGDFKAKQLTPGKFSHPNNTPWQLVATNVAQAAMTFSTSGASQDNRVVILSGGAVHAKEGGITGSWETANIYDNALSVYATGYTICARVNPAGQLRVDCKAGTLTAPPVLTYLGASDFRISGDRFLALKANGNAEAMQGTLTQNSGWLFVNLGSAAAIDLN